MPTTSNNRNWIIDGMAHMNINLSAPSQQQINFNINDT